MNASHYNIEVNLWLCETLNKNMTFMIRDLKRRFNNLIFYLEPQQHIDEPHRQFQLS